MKAKTLLPVLITLSGHVYQASLSTGEWEESSIKIGAQDKIGYMSNSSNMSVLVSTKGGRVRLGKVVSSQAGDLSILWSSDIPAKAEDVLACDSAMSKVVVKRTKLAILRRIGRSWRVDYLPICTKAHWSLGRSLIWMLETWQC